MAKRRLRVQFEQIGQASQEIIPNQPKDSSDEHLIANITYTLSVDGKPAGKFSSTIKQTPGSNFGDKDALEVTPPSGYKGPLDYARFSQVARDYYLGALRQFIGFGPNTHVTMRGNVFSIPHQVEFDVDDESTKAW